MSYEETIVYVPFGEDRICGVICGPEGEAHDLGVVLCTGGNYTRSHRNRMWVRTARDLAERGFFSIRFDYHGVGDSSGSGVMDLENPFDDDVIAVANFLQRATGVPRLAFAATCFGGRNAVPAAARHPNVTSITVFPMPIRAPEAKSQVRRRTKARKWLLGRKWGARLLRHPSVKDLRHRGADRAAGRTGEGRSVISSKFKRDLVTFLKRGEARFVYGELTDSLADMQQCIAEITPHLAAEERARLHLDIVPGMVLQGFQKIGDQDTVVERVVQSIEQTHGSLLRS